MNKEMLLDSYEKNGNGTVEEMLQMLKEIDDHTHLIKMTTDGLTILTYRKDSEDGQTMLATMHRGQKHSGVSANFSKMHAGEGDCMREELYRHKIQFLIDGKIYFSTKKVYRTLSQRMESTAGGPENADEYQIRVYRDAMYSEYFSAHPEGCTVMYREADDGTKKIFSVFSSKYGPIQQEVVTRAMVQEFEKEMGKASLVRYHIDNYNTGFLLEFPEKAKDFAEVYQDLPADVVPGLYIRMSDTGDASFIISGTMRIGKSVLTIPGTEYKRSHTMKASVEKIVKEVSNRIFPEYTKVPQRLLELLTIPVNDVPHLLEDVAASCGMNAALGKKRTRAMLDNLKAEVSPVEHTAYDVAMMFIDVSESYVDQVKDAKTKGNIRAAFVNTLFYEYGGIN